MLKLKTVLEKLGAKQVDLARALGVSPATVAQLINHGQWPKRFNQHDLKSDICAWLEKAGAAEADIAHAFEEVEPPHGNAAAPATSPKSADPEPMEETMLLRRQILSPQAKRHFGLFRDPFDNDVQAAEDVFVTPDIRYVREAMYQVAKNGGFMAVVGESGAGKSTLRRDLADRILRESQPITLIEPFVLGMEDNDQKGKTLKASHIAEAIITALSPLENPKRSAEARFRQLHKALKDSRRAGGSHCLVIEEAHGLSIPTLKHLKRFFELEDGFKKLLSIILIGQPELKLKLSEQSHEVREVVQRCEIVELAPLDKSLPDYLKFKFDRIGKPLPELIDDAGIDAIATKLTVLANNRRDSISLLYPLAVNNLLTATMNFAATLGAPKISADLVREV